MLIRMLQTKRGAADELGRVCATFTAGWQGDVLDSTAAVFVREGWAVPVAADPEPEAVAVVAHPERRKPAQTRKRKPVQPNKRKA